MKSLKWIKGGNILGIQIIQEYCKRRDTRKYMTKTTIDR